MKTIFTSSLLATALFFNAQNNPLKINPNIQLPSDSLQSKALVSSLNSFLEAAQKPNEENKYVLESEKIETFILLDEFAGIEKSGRFKDDYFYKPYLNDVVPLRDNTFLIKISYIGSSEKEVLLRATFEVIAHKSDKGFLFSSPLLRNTAHWKQEKTGHSTYHYLQTINKANVQEYGKLAALFDAKLKSKDKNCDFYLCDNSQELQKLVGVLYKSDYNSQKETVWSSTFGNRKLIVFGNNNSSFNNFDPHDLWHDRLSLVVPRNKVYKLVDEGCAYLYGGSWGLSWPMILQKFKQKVASNKNTNWMEVKEKPLNFGDDEKTHLYADYVVNALIIKKLEKEKGFEVVWQFLNCGTVEKGTDAYYQSLEKLTGITKANYNQKVWELVNNEK